MPINQISIPSRQPEESTLQKIALGINIINNTLGTALKVPEYLQQKKSAEADIAYKNAQAEKALRNDPYEAAQHQEGMRKLGKPTVEQSTIFHGNFPNQPIPDTVGQMEDIFKAQAGAINVTPFEQQGRAMEIKKMKDAEEEKTRKVEEERQGRYIKDLGVFAQTTDDAKQIKSSLSAKKQAENEIDKLIDLRTKQGPTILNREAVADALQRAANISLQIKQMAQLGVLSKTDFEFLDRIIPRNPLAYTPAMIMGQDPIMVQLKNLKENLNNRLNGEIEARGVTKEFQPLMHLETPTHKEANDF